MLAALNGEKQLKCLIQIPPSKDIKPVITTILEAPVLVTLTIIAPSTTSSQVSSTISVPSTTTSTRGATSTSTCDYLTDPKNIPVDLLYDGFYDNSHMLRDVVDPEKMKIYKDSLTPITTLTDFLNQAGDSNTRINTTQIADVVKVVDAWNTNRGMFGETNRQGRYVRNWRLSTIAATFLKLKYKFSPEQAATYNKYTKAIQSIILNDRLPNVNNHKIFEFLGLTLSSMALGQDHEQYYNELLEQIESDNFQDGFIVSEGRGFRVMLYHVFYMKAALTTLYAHKLSKGVVPQKSIMDRLNKVILRLEANDVKPYKAFFNYTSDSSLDSKYESITPKNLRIIYNNLVFGTPLPYTRIDYMGDLATIPK